MDKASNRAGLRYILEFSSADQDTRRGCWWFQDRFRRCVPCQYPVTGGQWPAKFLQRITLRAPFQRLRRDCGCMSGDSADRSCAQIVFCVRPHPRWLRRPCPTLLPRTEAAHRLLRASPENYFQRTAARLSVRPSFRRILLLRAVRRVIRSAQKLLREVQVGLAAFFRLLCVGLRLREDIPRERADRATRGTRRSVRSCAAMKVRALRPKHSRNCQDAISN